MDSDKWPNLMYIVPNQIKLSGSDGFCLIRNIEL